MSKKSSKKSTKKSAKKTAPKPTQVSASKTSSAADAIRSLPATMKAKDVVETLKRRGIRATMSYVYNVRLAARQSGKKGKKSATGGSVNHASFDAKSMEIAQRFVSELRAAVLQSLVEGA